MSRQRGAHPCGSDRLSATDVIRARNDLRDYSLKRTSHTIDSPNRPILCHVDCFSFILSRCVDATDCRGGSRFWRSSSQPFPMTPTGVLDTTSLRYSLCPSSDEIPTAPVENYL